MKPFKGGSTKKLSLSGRTLSFLHDAQVQYHTPIIPVSFRWTVLKVPGSVLSMDQKPLKQAEIRDRIDSEVAHIMAWTTVLKALDQKSPEIIEIPSHVIGEIGDSIQRSTLMIQEMMDSLAAQLVPNQEQE